MFIKINKVFIREEQNSTVSVWVKKTELWNEEAYLNIIHTPVPKCKEMEVRELSAGSAEIEWLLLIRILNQQKCLHFNWTAEQLALKSC